MSRPGVRGMIAGLLVLALGTAGCGPRWDPDEVAAWQAGADRTDEAPLVSEPAQVPEVVAAEPPPPPAPPVSEPAPAPAVTEEEERVSMRELGEQFAGTIELQLEVRPGCATIGEQVLVRITTEPHAELSFVVSYSDGRPHGRMGFAGAGANGVYNWTWVLGPEVPPGRATVVVQSWSEDRERGGNGLDEFVVAGVEGC